MSDINNKLLEMYLANGATSKNISMAERECLISQGATDGTWATYLASQGYAGGVNDMMYKFLGDKGYTAQGLQERWYQGALGGNLFVVPFDPNTLLTAGQYGDFMRVSESVPASSGGLLTRWPGLRTSANADMRFDVTPYASAPSVGAYGPNGEACIRLANGNIFAGSADRGGASSLNLPAGPGADTLDGNGLVVAVRVKFSGTGNTFLEFSIVDSNQAVFDYEKFGSTISLSWRNTATDGDVVNPTVTGWNTYAVARKKNRTTTLYLNGAVVHSFTDADDRTLYRWLQRITAGSETCDVSAYFYGHCDMTDQQVADLTTWMEG